MADEQTEIVGPKESDLDSTEPIEVTQAEMDEWFRRVFGGPREVR